MRTVMHLRSADCALLLVDLRVNNSFFTHWRVRRICVACIFVPDSMPFGHAVTEVTIVLVSHDSLLFTMSSVRCGAVRSLHNSQRMKRRKKKMQTNQLHYGALRTPLDMRREHDMTICSWRCPLCLRCSTIQCVLDICANVVLVNSKS